MWLGFSNGGLRQQDMGSRYFLVCELIRKKWLGDAYLDRIARMYPMPPSVNPSTAMRMNAVIGYSRYESTCMCT